MVINTVLLGVGGSIYTSHTLNHLQELILDTQKACKTAHKLHAHSVLNAHKLTTSRSSRRACSPPHCFLGKRFSFVWLFWP